MHDGSFFQKLIYEAYSTWEKNETWSYGQFIDSLDKTHKAAVLVSDLNLQVKRRGFECWDLCGYSEKADDLFEVLIEFVDDTDSEVGDEVLSLLRSYTMALKIPTIRIRIGDLFNSDEYRKYKEEEEWLTSKYRKIGDRFLREFRDWLAKKYKKRIKR